MENWALTDWSEGTKGLDRLFARCVLIYILRVALAAAFAAVGTVMLAVLLRSHTPPAATVSTILFNQFLWLLMIATSLPLGLLSVDDPKNLAGLRLELPGQIAQFPVKVNYRMSGLEYGVDRGLAMFVDGTLVFHGVRSRFSVGNATAAKTKIIRPGPSARLAIEFVNGDKKYDISMTPYRSFPGLGSELVWSFDEAAARWHSRGFGDGHDTIAPPLTPHEELVKQAALTVAGYLVLTYWAVVVGGIGIVCASRMPGQQWLPFAVVGAILFPLSMLAAAGYFTCRWSVLRRLAKDTNYAEGYGGVMIGTGQRVQDDVEVVENHVSA